MKQNQNPNPKSTPSKVATPKYEWTRDPDPEKAKQMCLECTLPPGRILGQAQHQTLTCMMCFSRLNGWDTTPMPKNPFEIPR